MLRNELYPVLAEIYVTQCGVGVGKSTLSLTRLEGSRQASGSGRKGPEPLGSILNPRVDLNCLPLTLPLGSEGTSHTQYCLLPPSFHTHSRLTHFPFLSKDSTQFSSLLPHSSDPILSSFPQRRGPICLHPSPCTCHHVPPQLLNPVLTSFRRLPLAPLPPCSPTTPWPRFRSPCSQVATPSPQLWRPGFLLSPATPSWDLTPFSPFSRLRGPSTSSDWLFPRMQGGGRC